MKCKKVRRRDKNVSGRYSMDFMTENKKRLIEYFKEGIKEPGTPLTMGLELEHFIVDRATKKSILYTGEHGVEALMKELMPYYTETVYSDNHLIGLYRDNLAISIEPAAQLEVSISPQSDERRIQFYYDQFLKEIHPILREWNYELVTTGYQPQTKVSDLEVIPKTRYRYMDDYFRNIGPAGAYMMKGTAATQISIDYYSEEDFMAKYKIAFTLYPVLALLCDNVPVFEGNDNTEWLKRMTIWDHVDAKRVDVTPFMKHGTLDFASYADFVCSSPLIIAKKENGDYATSQTVNELFANRLMSREEMEHVLSMVFPMVRLKHYLEIRVADSMPIGSVNAYLLFIKGIFRDISRVSAYVDELLSTNENFSRALLEAIRSNGMQASVGSVRVRDIIIELYGMVLGNLEEWEAAYLDEYKKNILDKGSLLL